ncbi:carbonic anhydrase [Kribbia dieselivorans]|uniref:carbonic anhydrase n=1 Tax=Kribbia dieselivorans TaxID=331526 RepID=UPI0008394B71
MVEGNRRFVEGHTLHPNQDVAHRQTLADGQAPFAVLFGCGDSRVAAEMVFDQGLGDLFVVRTAGQVIDATVTGSIEFGAEILGTPLIVVLGHDSCGAVKAAMESTDSGAMPGGYIRDLVEKVMPSVVQARAHGITEPNAIGAWHVQRTVRMLAERSTIIWRRIKAGKLGIVGVEYALTDGAINVVAHLGDLGDLPNDISEATNLS